MESLTKEQKETAATAIHEEAGGNHFLRMIQILERIEINTRK